MSKFILVCLLSLSVPAGAHGQTPALPAARQVRFAQRPPESAKPTAATRQSTALSAAATVSREPVRHLPSLATTDRDGKAADLQTNSRTGHWLLLYRRPECAPCDRLMETLAQAKDSVFQHGAAFTVVVAGSSADALDRTHAQFPLWSDATWMADPHGDAFRQLKLTGAPVLLAMNGSEVFFRVAGTLGNPATVQTLATTWLTGGTTASATAVSSPGKPATTTP